MNKNMTGSSAQRELHFYLTLQQSSLLLEALVEQPFKLVFEIIGQLNHQAQQFYQAEAERTAPALFVISAADFSICIKALGELPYNRVCELVNYLHQQLQTQQAGVVHPRATSKTARESEQ
jgi:DNA phosphorothioation-dependent restriction protein DptG